MSIDSLVNPQDWRNPEPARLYDLVVIGGGTAGLVSAAGAAGLGARVALIERHRLGGDCLNTGCVPSKALLHAGRTRMTFAEAMAHVRRSQASIAPHDSAERFESLGVDVFFGQASFADPRTVAVEGGPKGGPERPRLRFRRAVVATGSRPIVPELSGVSANRVVTTDTVFDMTEQPRSLLVVGAGPVGCELAQAFAWLGTAVTLVDKAPRVLTGEDSDASAVIARALERSGVNLQLGGAVDVSARADDVILVATGRTPNIDGLNLDAAGIRSTVDGIEVTDTLRTSNVRVYAAGDVCSRFKFTHAADALARIAIQNALFFTRKRTSALVIPWCTYTSPEVAAVGNRDGASITIPLTSLDRAIVEDESEGFFRVHHAGGRITGATIVAPNAGESIGHLTHLIRTRGTLADLSSTIFPYPTMAEALRKAGDAYRRQALTPRARALLSRYFGLLRGRRRA